MKRYYSLFHKPLVLAGLWLALLLFGQPSSTYAQVGQIWAWGDNTYGEIGQGYFPWSTTPTKVLNITNVIKVAVGDYHTLALKSDGTVWAWGDNAMGQLGDPSLAPRNLPAQVAGLSGITQILVQSTSSFALKSDGTVWAWGYNSGGQLGDGTTTDRHVPTQVAGLSNVTQIATSGGHCLALKADKSVWAWGANSSGQLGDGTQTSRLQPIKIPNLTNVVQVGAGGNNSFVLKADGTVWSWGSRGPLLGMVITSDNLLTPTQIPNFTSVKQLSCGNNSVVVIKQDGTVWAWGDALNYTPYQIAGISGAVQTGEAGAWLVTKSDGTVWYWASDHVPSKMEGISNAKQATTGGLAWFVVKSDGTVWSWGFYARGMLGNGDYCFEPTPLPITSLSNVVQISTSTWSTPYALALKSDGTVWAWGDNTNRTLGDGTRITKNTPTQITGLTGIVQVVAGYQNAIAIKADGTVWKWGFLTSNDDAGLPQQITDLSGVVQATVGINFLYALKSDGTVWGESLEPGGLSATQVTSIQDVVQIVSTSFTGCTVLKSDGTLWSWDEWSKSTTPSPYTNLSNVVQFCPNLALLSDGTVWRWGEGFGGESPVPSATPVLVPNLTGITQVSTGFHGVGSAGANQFVDAGHYLALKSDGTVWAWGDNHMGQLGDGTIFRTPTPVQVLNVANQNLITATGHFSCSVQAVQLTTTTSTTDFSQPFSSVLKVGAKLREQRGIGVIQRPLSVTVDGVAIGSARTNAGGYLTLTSKQASQFGVGKHTLKVTFAGDRLYKTSAATATVTITKADTKTAVPNLTLRPGDTNPLMATLVYKADNSPVVGASVKFSIDGVVTGTATTDSKGTAALPYVVDGTLKLGAHTLKAEFAGDTNQTASSGTGTLTLAQAPTQVSATDGTGKAGGTVTLTAKLVRTTDNGVLGSQVLHFQIDGVEVGTGTTNSTGTAAYKYRIPSTMKKGKHPIKVIFNGDTLYQTSNDATKNLTVN